MIYNIYYRYFNSLLQHRKVIKVMNYYKHFYDKRTIVDDIGYISCLPLQDWNMTGKDVVKESLIDIKVSYTNILIPRREIPCACRGNLLK